MRDMDLLRNRKVFFVGVNTGYVSDGLPDERYVEFYRRRSSPRLHCAIIGNVVVPNGHGSNASTPMLSSASIWGKIASEISERGSVPGIQLATAWPDYQGMRGFVSDRPGKTLSAAQKLIDKMGQQGVSDTLGAFECGAAIAIAHGFRHIQFHAAHGYLLSLLVDKRINPRAGYVLERLEGEVTNLVSKGVEVSIRISLRTGDPAFDAIGREEFHDTISSLPFSYVDLSSGFYNIDKRLIYPSRPEFISERAEETKSVSLKHPGRKFIYSGRALRDEDGKFPENVHLGLCRDLIANPDFLDQQGATSGCENRGKCHYFSRNEDSLTCALWD